MSNENSGLSRFLSSGGSSSSNAAEDYTAAVTKFKFQELAAATKNFAPELLLGEGEFGRTYKGCLKSSGQVVAVRVNQGRISNVHRNSDQSMLSAIHLRTSLNHPNIVDMIGYSIDGDQIVFVHEFMPLGSLKDCFYNLGRNKKPLDWNTRMKIAAGAAKGLKYLHDESNPPIIHANIKPSNVLLCEGYHPKLSDFLGFKEQIAGGAESRYARHFGVRPHHHAPEFYCYLKLTQQSDIYSFGLVLFELISGCMAEIKPVFIQSAIRALVGGKEFTRVADPLLKGRYPEQGFYQALFLAAECLHDEDVKRPRIGHVVNVLSNLASEIYDPNAIQINRASTLTIGNFERERLRQQWRHVCC